MNYFNKAIGGADSKQSSDICGVSDIETLLFLNDFVQEKGVDLHVEDVIRSLSSLSVDEKKDRIQMLFQKLSQAIFSFGISKKELQKMIGEYSKIQGFPNSCDISISPSQEGFLLASLEDKAAHLALAIIAEIGVNEFASFVKRATANSLLREVRVDKVLGLDFSLPAEKWVKLPPQWLKLVERVMQDFIHEMKELDLHKKNNDSEHNKEIVVPVSLAAENMMSSIGLRSFLEEGFIRDVSAQAITNTGSISVALTATTLRDDNDVVQGMIFVCKDMREIEMKQKEVEELARIFQENPSPVLRVSADGILITSNVPGKELMEKNGIEIGKKVSEKCQKIIRMAMEREEGEEEKTYTYEEGDRYYSIVTSVSPQREYVNMYIRDITALKEAQDALEKEKNSLEEKVSMRTKELEEAKAGLEEAVERRTQDLQDAVRELKEKEKELSRINVQVDASNQQLSAANQQMKAANEQLKLSQQELQQKMLELESFNEVAVGRELKMIELKEEIDRLKKKIDMHSDTSSQSTQS